MIRSSPATAMLMRFRWLMKQSAISRETIRQRTVSNGLPVGLVGGVTGRSSNSTVQSSREIPTPTRQRSSQSQVPSATALRRKDGGPAADNRLVRPRIIRRENANYRQKRRQRFDVWGNGYDSRSESAAARDFSEFEIPSRSLLRDAGNLSGDGLPAAIAFHKHVGKSVLPAGVFALVAALFRFEPVHYCRVAVSAHLQVIQLAKLLP